MFLSSSRLPRKKNHEQKDHKKIDKNQKEEQEIEHIFFLKVHAYNF